MGSAEVRVGVYARVSKRKGRKPTKKGEAKNKKFVKVN